MLCYSHQRIFTASSSFRPFVSNLCAFSSRLDYDLGVRSTSPELTPPGGKIGHKTRGELLRGLTKRTPIQGVKYVIAVASGREGVGKSTTAVNLAVALSQTDKGSKVGLLDADVYKPSLPTLMNLSGKPERNHQNLLIPLVNYGIKCMSMGFLIDQKSVTASMRGLRVMSAIQKLLRNVLWGPLDYLVIDLPPGAGDVQLSISQNIPVSGSVIVTTPQDQSQRPVDMLCQVAVPVLGLVENMSVYVCPNCGHSEHAVGARGTHHLAREMEACILGDVPLTSAVKELSDTGQPVVIAFPDSPASVVYRSIAEVIRAKLQDQDPLV